MGKPPEVAGTEINAMLTKVVTASKQSKAKRFKTGWRRLACLRKRSRHTSTAMRAARSMTFWRA